MPKLTVLMPAHKAGSTIESAVRSTLRAMPSDSELVVAVDGPDPETEAGVGRVQDPRLVVHVDSVNRGTVACMRRMLQRTDSELVARMDADDISLPWRFRVSMQALSNAEIVCGSGIRFGKGKVPRPSYPRSLTHREVGLLLPFVNPLFHPSMVARRRCLVAARAYEQPSAAEDYVLWLNACLNGDRAVKLATPLVAYRLSPDQLSGAPDYVRRVREDPQVRQAYAAWAEASGMSWLLRNGGGPGAPVGTRDELAGVVSGVRRRTRGYARRQVASVATVLPGH